MYARVVGTRAGGLRELDFGVSGNLWHGVLVMYDRQTGSSWTQIGGRAIEGELASTKLGHVPSTFTTWAQWRALHPETEVLFKPEEERGQAESNYADYFDDEGRLYLPHLGEGLGGVGPKDVVFGVVVNGEAFAVTQDLVVRQGGLAQAFVGGVAIAWLYDAESGRLRAVRAEGSDGRPVVLGAVGDEPPTAAVGWTVLQDGRKAIGVAGSPDSLHDVRVDRAYWYAWRRSHPGSRVLSD